MYRLYRECQMCHFSASVYFIWFWEEIYLSRFVELLCSNSKWSCTFQISLSLCKLGCRHHLHGLSDLLDVLDRLQPHGNQLEVRHLGC